MSFANNSIIAQGGYFVYSTPFPVFGPGGSMSMTFTLPGAQAALQLRWYGHKTGSPPVPLQGQLKDSNGTVLGTTTTAASLIGAQGADPLPSKWQPAMAFTGPFSAGRYTLVLTALGATDPNNGYTAWLLSDFVNDGQGIWLAPGNGSSGSPCILVSDGSGSLITAYPFQALNDGKFGPTLPQSFIAPVSSSSQMLVQYITDRHKDPRPGSVTVNDSLGALLATGALDEQLTAGSQGMMPIALDKVVNFVAGQSYSIRLGSDPGQTWSVPLRGIYSDPPLPGFASNLIDAFKVPASSYVPVFSDVFSITSTGLDAIYRQQSQGVSFIPGASANLTEFHVLMYPSGGDPQFGFHAPGDTLVASLYASQPLPSPPFFQATGSPLQSVSVASDKVPWRGFVDFTGFSFPLTAGTRYWIVLSSPDATGGGGRTFATARLVTPFKFLVLVWKSSGGWSYMAEGPSDLSFRVVTSQEQIGNFISDIPELLGDAAQPFIAPSNMAVNGVTLLSGFKIGGGWNSYVTVGIYPDSGVSAPGGPALGSGKFRVAEQGYPGSEHVGFDTAASIIGGKKYWVVMKNGAGITTRGLSPIVYYIQPPNWPVGLNALLDPNGSGAWQPIPGVAAIIPFGLAAQTGATTTVPTSVTVRASAR